MGIKRSVFSLSVALGVGALGSLAGAATISPLPTPLRNSAALLSVEDTAHGRVLHLEIVGGAAKQLCQVAGLAQAHLGARRANRVGQKTQNATCRIDEFGVATYVTRIDETGRMTPAEASEQLQRGRTLVGGVSLKAVRKNSKSPVTELSVYVHRIGANVCQGIGLGLGDSEANGTLVSKDASSCLQVASNDIRFGFRVLKDGEVLPLAK